MLTICKYNYQHWCLSVQIPSLIFVIFLLSNSNSNFETGCAEGSLSSLAKLLKYGSERAYTDQNTTCINKTLVN